MTRKTKPTARVSRKRTESTLLARIRLAVGARPDFLVTRINTGVFDVTTARGTKGKVRSAPTGFPDLIGTQLRRVVAREVREHTFGRHERDYWHIYGQSIAVETKSVKGVLSTAQKNWRAAFEAMGGVYILARSVEDVTDALGDVPTWKRA